MSKLVTLNIDGRDVTVPDGLTILEAASHVGIEIPHLCYFEGLPKTGACRLCLVELEGAGLVVSCIRRVRDGMVVRTKTERVLNARRFVLELIWSIHPGDCTTCDKSGDCELQKYTYDLGVQKRRFPLRRTDYPVDTTNPLIERDLNLCILCGRCIRICQIHGNYVLDFMNRGIATKVTTPRDNPLQESGCTFCGSCISICPVGCLVEKTRRNRGREWEFKSTKTVCAYCGMGCNLILDTTDNQIVRARTERKDDYLCVRGRFGWDYVMSDERLKTPLIKKNGTLRECSWDEALEHVAKRFLKIKKERGADALGGLVSANYPNETLYLFGKFVRACLGTNNIDSSVRLLNYPTLAGLNRAFGRIDIVPTLSEIEEADTLLVLNSDVTVSYPAVGVRIKKAVKRGANLITIDPRKTEVAGLSQIHLQPKPGTEAVLLDGIIKAIINEGLYDKEFVSTKCNNFKEFSGAIPEFNIEERTKVAKDDVNKVAKLLGEREKKTIIVFSPEAIGLHTVSRITNLLMLTGRVKGGVYPCLLLSNLWGAAEVGALTEFYPGNWSVEDAAARKRLEGIWGVTLPSKRGLSAIEMIKASSSSVFGMYILGENPAVSFPDTTGIVKALSSLEFLVVQDIFLTETAQLADVVLPGVSFAESSGTVINAEGKVQEISRAIKPQTRLEWEVIAQLSSMMGYSMKYDSEREIAAEIKAIGPCEIKEKGFRFEVTETGEAGEEPNKDYPYRLMTGSNLFGFGDGTWTRRSKISLLESPREGFIGISPQDAQSLGVVDGSRVAVSSRRGSITTTVKIQESLPPGLVFMPTHSPNCNKLTSSELDRETRSPRFRLSAVKITPGGN